MTKVVTTVNSKGGVAKTTTTVQAAHEWAKQGKKVLIIDGDSQLSATISLGVEPRPGQATILAVLTEPSQGIARAIVPYRGTPQFPLQYPRGGKIDVIPGARHVTGAPATFDKTKDRQPVPTFNHVLPYLISTYCGDYDYVIIDPSPSTDRVNQAIIFAADIAIAPVAAEPMAISGVQQLLETLAEMNEARARLQIHGQTSLAGLLVAKVYPDQMEVLTSLHAALDHAHILHFGKLYIPYTTAGWKSAGEFVPIDCYQPDDAAAIAYRAVVQSL